MSVVQCSCLGTHGRFGNQLLQWAIANKYAQDAGARLETPSWIGQKLFGIRNDPISHPLPQTEPDKFEWGKPNVDIYGWFQHVDFLKHLKRSELKRWFTFLPEFQNKFTKPKQCYIAAHIRRGDYVKEFSHIFCTITEQSYINACEKFKLDKNKLIFVREDKHQINTELQFLPDFFTLLNADVILRANSTFSWWAAVLGNGKVFSPLVENLTGEHTVEFVAGNWPKMTNNPNAYLSDLYLDM
jgi:hypothetical protein